MGNIRNAAIVLKNLPAEHTRELMARLSPAQAECLADEVARTAAIPAAEECDVLRQFTAGFRSPAA